MTVAWILVHLGNCVNTSCYGLFVLVQVVLFPSVYLCDKSDLLPADSVSYTNHNPPSDFFLPLRRTERVWWQMREQLSYYQRRQQTVSFCVPVCMLCTCWSVSSITIFSVLLRLTSFLFLRRDWLSSMSMMRMRGMVPPPMRRMVKSTMMMVVVPISCRFSMGSRPRWRLNA